MWLLFGNDLFSGNFLISLLFFENCILKTFKRIRVVSVISILFDRLIATLGAEFMCIVDYVFHLVFIFTVVLAAILLCRWWKSPLLFLSNRRNSISKLGSMIVVIISFERTAVTLNVIDKMLSLLVDIVIFSGQTIIQVSICIGN